MNQPSCFLRLDDFGCCLAAASSLALTNADKWPILSNPLEHDDRAAHIEEMRCKVANLPGEKFASAEFFLRYLRTGAASTYVASWQKSSCLRVCQDRQTMHCPAEVCSANRAFSRQNGHISVQFLDSRYSLHNDKAILERHYPPGVISWGFEESRC